MCEVPGWGHQLPPERVLHEARYLRFQAIEAGPPGFLPADPLAAAGLLAHHGFRLVGGFVTAVLHDAAVRERGLAEVERQATWLAAGGAEVLVLAAATGRVGYDTTEELDLAAWTTLFDSLARAEEITERRDLALAVHPHFGTVLERQEDVERFLLGCPSALCLDTGHLVLGGADPAMVARAAGARVRHVHLKDIDAGLVERVRSRALSYAAAVARGLYRPLGAGGANIAAVLKELRALDYDGWYVLEQDVMLAAEPAEGGGPVRDVAASLRFVSARV